MHYLVYGLPNVLYLESKNRFDFLRNQYFCLASFKLLPQRFMNSFS